MGRIGTLSLTGTVACCLHFEQLVRRFLTGGQANSACSLDRMERVDAVIIGAGHNGLTAAAYLAQAGLSVLVVEANDYIGGAAVSREVEPGFVYSSCSYALSLLRPEIIHDLDLTQHGLRTIPYQGSVTMFGDGRFLASSPHPETMRRELARHSPVDADAYQLYSRDLQRQAELVSPLLLDAPPDPASLSWKDLKKNLRLIERFTSGGADGLTASIRFWTASVAHLLDRYFESDVVKAHFAASGVIGTGLGPMSPGTAYVLLHHRLGGIDGTSGGWGYVRGGMGQVSHALASSVQASGGEVRVSSPVDEVLVRKGKATGVLLSDGTEIEAGIVVSGLELKRSILSLLDWSALPKGFADRVSHFRTRGSSAKLNIALKGLPEFSSVPTDCPALDGDVRLCGTIADMERAYDDWKEQVMPRDPYIEMVVPSRLDPTLAPPGKHVASVFVQYVPDTLIDGGWTDRKREELQETVLDKIERHAPGFRELVVHVETRSPADLESEIGLTQGNIFHGELTLDQLLFNRPLPELANYRTPIRGYYLCGSSMHPGGGVMGAPGANAARTILNDVMPRRARRAAL